MEEALIVIGILSILTFAILVSTLIFVVKNATELKKFVDKRHDTTIHNIRGGLNGVRNAVDEVKKLYICSYGQSSINLCPLVGEECDRKDNCNLRPVVNYEDFVRIYNEVVKGNKNNYEL